MQPTRHRVYDDE